MNIKFNIEYYEVLDSTNEFLLEKIDPNNFHGRVICAHLQKKGRGRYGRNWESGDSRDNIALSIGFQVSKEDSAFLPYIPMLVAIETYDSIAALLKEQEKQYLSLKWPNDLIWKGYKLMGILTQSKEWNKSIWLCVGLGINVNWHPKHMLATSLSELPLKEKCPPTKEKLIQQILKKVESNYKYWKDFLYIKKCWEQKSSHIGKEIYYGTSAKDYSKSSTMLGLDASGGLLIQEKDGKKKVLSADDISVKLS